MKNDQTCELIQLSISDSIDANEKLSSTDSAHIESCTECAKFLQLWQAESTITAIASGKLLQQQDLAAPIISQLEKDQTIAPLREDNIIRGKFLRIASIAAVIAIVSAFTFQTMLQKDAQIGTTTSTVNTSTNNDELNLSIPKLELDLTLTEASIEKSLEENYQKVSLAASDRWKTATSSISRATEYIANGTHYISAKYLPSKKGGTSGPQSRSTPQQDETNQLQYG